MVDYRSKIQSAPISGVNITPFTDVVLVLLIVFMVSAPGILSSVLHIQLPHASSTDRVKNRSRVIGIDSKGNLFLDGSAVSKEDLTETIKKSLEKEEGTGFTVNADSRTPHGLVVEVLDLLRSSGVQKISVGTVQN